MIGEAAEVVGEGFAGGCCRAASSSGCIGLGLGMSVLAADGYADARYESGTAIGCGATRASGCTGEVVCLDFSAGSFFIFFAISLRVAEKSTELRR